MNRKDYICGMNNIINDKSKFKLLTADRASSGEGQLKRFLRKLKIGGFLLKMYIKVFILSSVNVTKSADHFLCSDTFSFVEELKTVSVTNKYMSLMK